MKNNLGNKQTMAENIQHYMDKENKSRQEMCEAIYVPYTTLTDWLKANTYPRIDKIEIMAHYFGVSKADLVEERNDTKEKPATDNDDGLTSEQKEAIEKIKGIKDPALHQRVMGYLEALENQDKD